MTDCLLHPQPPEHRCRPRSPADHPLRVAHPPWQGSLHWPGRGGTVPTGQTPSVSRGNGQGTLHRPRLCPCPHARARCRPSPGFHPA
eukprot:2287262-Pyramimonas_sp.AAC.3